MTSHAPTASLYVRLSKEAGESNLSLSGMLKDLRSFAASRGFFVIGEHTDDGISGAVRDRPSFLAWLADGSSGRADVLLTYHADRLTREGVNAAALVLDVVEGKDPSTGAVVRSPVRLLDVHGLDSEDGDSFRLRFVIAAEIARGERARMVSRTRASRERLAEAGRYAGGQAPYGYVSAANPKGPGRILVPDPTEVAVIREAVRRVLDGETPFSIARDLNSRGIPPKRAKRWSSNVLRDVLASETLLGRVVGGRDSRGTRSSLLGPDGLPRTFWEPVLDAATHARVVAALARTAHPNRGRLKERQRASRLLSGLARCAYCDSRLYVRSSGKGIRSYVCWTPGTAKATDCPGVSVNAERLEEYVEDRFLSTVGDLSVYTLSASISTGEAEAAAVEREITDVLAAMRADGADVVALAGRLSALKDRAAVLRSAPPSAPSLVPTGRTFREEWGVRSVEGRSALLRDNVALLTVSKGRKGYKGLDPSRVVLVAQPAQPVDEEGGRGGRVPAV